MKRTTIILACAAFVGLALLAGCNDFDREGKRIRFSAVTAGAPTTKTAYGADAPNGSTPWQIIDWVTNDEIRIVSDFAEDPSGNLYSDYKVGTVTTPYQTYKSSATLVNSNGNGLVWKDNIDNFTFYAVYPKPSSGGAVKSINSDPAPTGTPGNAPTTDEVEAWRLKLGKVKVSLPETLPLSGDPTQKSLYFDENGNALPSATGAKEVYSYSVYEPNMDYAVMTAAKENVGNGTDFELEFSPAFTAYEINLVSAEEDVTISEVALLGASDALAGTFQMKAGADLAVSPRPITVTDPKSSVAFTSPNADGLPLTVTTEDGVTTFSGLTCTLFAIPKANAGMISIRISTNQGTYTLPLTGTDKTSPYIFRPGQKYRINMLKMGISWKYKISLAPQDDPWDRVNVETIFSQNIESGPFVIYNAVETGNNYYPTGTKDFQVRTLDMSKDYGPGNQPYFLVEFTPMAPTGGYWKLIPETPVSLTAPYQPDDLTGVGTAAFKVEVWDTESETGSTSLQGQIMSKKVTLHITCNIPDDQRDVNHSIIIKSYFSSNINFDENATFSADSEIQDVHKDGSFSYWRFVIPKKTNN